MLSKDWLLFDSQSTKDQFINAKYFTDISHFEQPMTAYSNSGSIKTNQKGMFGTLRISYNPDMIANVISLKTRSAHYKVTYSSKDHGGMFIVNTLNGMMEFMHHPRGLHCLDLHKLVNADIMMAITLQEKFDGYTKRLTK